MNTKTELRREAIENGWCILRTSPSRTMALAASLRRAGFDAWTPIETKSFRPRGRRGKTEAEVPIMPTFVFAKSRHLVDLAALAEDPSQDHERFSVYRHLGRIPLVADVELEALRSEEIRAVPKEKQRVYGVGASVRVPEGAFRGMTGMVEDSDRRFTLVCFGSMRVKIATFLLRPDEILGMAA